MDILGAPPVLVANSDVGAPQMVCEQTAAAAAALSAALSAADSRILVREAQKPKCATASSEQL